MIVVLKFSLIVWFDCVGFALPYVAEQNIEASCRDNYIVYQEPYSKNHQGDLQQQHDQPKIVYHYANTNDRS